MSQLIKSIGILSIGDMGVGIGRLLKANNYSVLTTTAGRSKETSDRASGAGILDLQSDAALVAASDCILSIAPPRDALSIAKRIAEACRDAKVREERNRRAGSAKDAVAKPLVFIDLNAVSPKTATAVADIVSPKADTLVSVQFVDGGIIGGPPKQKPDERGQWSKPSLVMSGPTRLADELASVLNVKHVSEKIGQASGLKMCFASLSKGFIALAIQSYTTAHSLGVLPELQSHLDEFNPSARKMAERGLVGMPPKAYRWVEEMRQIGGTFRDDGGFSEHIFDGIAEVYRTVADDTILGMETIGERGRGTSSEDVAECLREGLQKRTKR